MSIRVARPGIAHPCHLPIATVVSRLISSMSIRRPGLNPLYYWTRTTRLWVLSWDGQAVGAVWFDGRWQLEWRGHQHKGKLGSAALARRCMESWLSYRGNGPPFRRRDKRRETVLLLDQQAQPLLHDHGELSF